MALMLRDASQRSEAVGAFVLPFALRCSSACGRPRPSSWVAERTNLWLWETIAGSPCLFPACYLQGTPQLQRAEPQGAVRRSYASCSVALHFFLLFTGAAELRSAHRRQDALSARETP